MNFRNAILLIGAITFAFIAGARVGADIQKKIDKQGVQVYQMYSNGGETCESLGK